MQPLRQILPVARPLVVFEAAARHLSFTRAAAELGMTQAAVSLAVRALEEHHGVPLFTRRHRAVVLTEAGRRLHADVALGLGHIRKGIAELAALGTDRHVTLSASTAFASFWMLPRLPRFREAMPGVDLRIQTSDRDLDILAERLPLALRGGQPGDWPGCESALLAEEEIVAIAAPAYLDAHGTPASDAEIARHRLIHLEEPFRPCPDWDDWFRGIGVAPPSRSSGLLINDYVLVVQAVLAGQGIALGWRHLVEPMLRAGLLVCVSRHSLATGAGFHVVWPARSEADSTALRVRDWMLGAGLP